MSVPQSYQIELSDEEIRVRVLTNIIKMITARGILAKDNLDKNIQIVLGQHSDNFLYKVKPEIANFPLIVIKLFTTKILSINKTSAINEFLNKNSEFHKIIVAKDMNDNNIKNIKSSNPRTEFFKETFLMINLLECEDVPEYQIISHDTEEYKNFWADYLLKKKQTPQLFSDRPVALYFNLKKNDLVRVIRADDAAGEAARYRLVV